MDVSHLLDLADDLVLYLHDYLVIERLFEHFGHVLAGGVDAFLEVGVAVGEVLGDVGEEHLADHRAVIPHLHLVVHRSLSQMRQEILLEGVPHAFRRVYQLVLE